MPYKSKYFLIIKAIKHSVYISNFLLGYIKRFSKLVSDNLTFFKNYVFFIKLIALIPKKDIKKIA